MEGRPLAYLTTSSTTPSASEPDLLLLGTPVTDEFSHQFLGLVTPTDIDGNPNPFYDDVTNDDVPDGRVDEREGYIRAAYQEADETLALGARADGRRRTRPSSSPPTTASRRSGYAVNVSKVLVDLGLQEREQSGNCRKAANDPAPRPRRHARQGVPRRRHVPDLHQPRRPRPGGRDTPQVPAANYEAVRNQIIAAFQNLDDPNLPGQQQVVLQGDQEGGAAERRRHRRAAPEPQRRRRRRPPAALPDRRADARAAGRASQFFGQHGYLPDLVDLRRNVNMHGDLHRRRAGIRDRQARSAASGRSTSPRRSPSCWASPGRRTPAARSSTTSSRAEPAAARSRSSTSATTTASSCRSPRRPTRLEAGAANPVPASAARRS